MIYLFKVYVLVTVLVVILVLVTSLVVAMAVVALNTLRDLVRSALALLHAAPGEPISIFRHLNSKEL